MTTFRTAWTSTWTALAAVAAFACSSGGGGNAYSATNCPNAGISGSSSCQSCLTSKCGSQVTAANNDCASIYSCVCPSGASTGSCQATMNCQSSGTALLTCESQSCATECSTASSSSSGGGSGSGSGGVSSCLASSTTQACIQCIEQSCNGQLGSLESACTAYISCICPGGVYNSGLVNGCQPDINAACSSAANVLGNCETNSCATACGVTSSSGSGSSSGGTSSSSSGSTGTPVACTTGTGTSQVCQVTPGLSSCGTGAQASSICPSANLAGCCTLPGGDETCFYDPTQATTNQSACQGSGGTWSTSP